MNKIRLIFFVFSSVAIVFSLTACLANNTQNPHDESCTSTSISFELKYPELLTDIVYENKIAVSKYVDTLFDEPIINFKPPVKIKAFDWFDLSNSFDEEYVNIYRDFRESQIKLEKAKNDYDASPTKGNADKYEEYAKKHRQITAKLNNYSRDHEEEKISRLVNHFDSLDIISTVEDGMVCVTVNKEQLMSLLNTDFLFFAVYDNVEHDIG